MEEISGSLYDVQCDVYDGLTGYYDPELLIQECSGDTAEAARKVVDGAVSAGMITETDIIWVRPDGIRQTWSLYNLIEGYLEREVVNA